MQILVADFGQAFLLDNPARELTNAGGSLPWMAPELLVPESFDVDFRPTYATDMYAFACTCIEVVFKHIFVI